MIIHQQVRPRLYFPVVIIALIAVLAGAAVIYISDYYHAYITALDALRSDDLVTVTESGFGWFFDNDNRL